MGWMYPPQILYVEVLTHSVAIFEDGTSKEVIKVKLGHQGGTLFNRIHVLIRRDTRDQSPPPPLSLPTPRVKAMWAHSREGAVHKPGKGPSPKNKFALTMDYQPPDLWENIVKTTQTQARYGNPSSWIHHLNHI